jgi:hypothetical protein
LVAQGLVEYRELVESLEQLEQQALAESVELRELAGHKGFKE